MSRVFLTLALFLSCIYAKAQVTWFSETTGAYTVDSIFGSGLENQFALRLADGNIGVVSRGDANAIMLRTYGPSGELLSTFSDPTAFPYAFHYLTGAVLTPDKSAIVISGSKYDSLYNFKFFIAKLDLASKETKVVEFPAALSYQYAPYVTVAADGIYAAYPFYKYSVAAKYSNDLDPQWAKAFIPVGTDTITSKHPSMGGYFQDTCVVIFSKNESQLSLTRLSPVDGEVMGSKLFPLAGYTRIYSSTRLQDGNVVLSGLQDTEPFLMKCTPDGGTVFWAKKMFSASYPFYTYEGVVELPDGRLVALGCNAMGSNSFSGISTFDADGNHLGSRLLSLPSGPFYQMGRPVLDEFGLLAAGTTTSDWVEMQGVLQYTDFAMGQACHGEEVAFNAGDHVMGVPTELPPNSLTAWNLPLPGVSTIINLTESAYANPLICNLITSAAQPSGQGLIVSPNPVLGAEVQINLGKPGAYQLTLCDASGKVIRCHPVSGNIISLSTEGLAAGIYLLRAQDQQGNVLTQKLVVR